MDQAAEAEVADHGPAKFHDLLLRVVPQELIEQFLVDARVVDEEALRIMERGLFGIAEVGLTPVADALDDVLFEGLSFR